MELWNHVTMRYRRHDDGRLEPLPQPNVDTGMGLERLLMITQGVPSVFGCDVFAALDEHAARPVAARTSGRCACSPTTCAPAS